MISYRPSDSPSKMSNFQMDQGVRSPALFQRTTYQNLTHLFMVISFLCLSTFYFGFQLTVMSTIKKSTLQAAFGKEMQKNEVIGVLIGAMPLSAAAGALIAPVIFRSLSRKRFILLMNLLGIIAACIIQINNIYVLLACRIIQGFVVGNNMAIIPIYIHELTPKDILGSFGVATQFYVVFAVVFCYTLGVIFYVTDVEGSIVWRIMFSFTGFTCLIQTILLLTNVIPESPVSLIQMGRQEEARQILLKYNMEEVIEDVMSDKKSQSIKKSERAERDIFQVKETASLKGIFLAFQLPFMQQLSGINMIVTQIGSIIQGFNQNLAIYSPLFSNFIQLIATAFSVLLLRKLGRRCLILTGNLGLALCDIAIGILFLLNFLDGWKQTIDAVVVVILFFMVIYGLTIGPIVWLYVPEIIPAYLVPPATAMNWIGCSFCIIVPNFIINAVGSPYPVFFMYGGISLVFYILNVVFLIQTKGLTRSQALAKLR